VLTTFLFDVLFMSAPVERIQDRQVKQGIRIANSFIMAGVAAVLQKGGGGHAAFWLLGVGAVGAEHVREPGGPNQR
ncbi:hypothetical protein, partial [Klebsiella pneumoniae]|uniref:hypothetical protein n=1 Tax=Klebsiella pneumoniae TaxID=573 RepID=UPI0030136B06